MLSCQSVRHVLAVPLGYQEESFVIVNQLLCMLTAPAGSIPVLRHLRGHSLVSLFCSNFQGYMVFWCMVFWGRNLVHTAYASTPKAASNLLSCSSMLRGGVWAVLHCVVLQYVLD